MIGIGGLALVQPSDDIRQRLLWAPVGGKNVLSQVLSMWETEEPITVLVGNMLGRVSVPVCCWKVVLVLSLKIGELQAARLGNCCSFAANKDIKRH